LWHDKIEYPGSYGLGQYGTFQYSPRVEAMAKKYKVAAIAGKVFVSTDARDNLRACEAVVQASARIGLAIPNIPDAALLKESKAEPIPVSATRNRPLHVSPQPGA
jgi:hypothetical protein